MSTEVPFFVFHISQEGSGYDARQELHGSLNDHSRAVNELVVKDWGEADKKINANGSVECEFAGQSPVVEISKDKVHIIGPKNLVRHARTYYDAYLAAEEKYDNDFQTPKS